MRDKDNAEEIDSGPIDTFDLAAIIINSYVSQGRIKAMDQESQRLLDHLAKLVERHENAVLQGLFDAPLN